VSAPIYTGAVVRAPDGQVLCQLRDNNPGIICPGLWSCCPGGQVEATESPHEAIVRELMEEFEIDVSNVTPLLIHRENTGEYQGVYHAFYADLVTHIENVKCNEGERCKFFMPEQAVSLPQHPMSLVFLKAYIRLSSR